MEPSMRRIAFLSLCLCMLTLIFAASAGAVEYATLVGGNARDAAYSLAIDSEGEVLVAGLTRSPDFPHTTGAYMETFAGGDSDLFVIRLSADLGTLIASTFVGGNDHEGLDFEYDPDYQMDNAGPGMILDASGYILVTGNTMSADFPTTAGAHQTAHNGTYEDAYLLRLAPDLATLVQSTLFGGVHRDYGRRIVVEPDGSVVVGGDTRSADFPVSAGAYDSTYNGDERDVFLARFSSDLSAITEATLFGGAGNEYCRALLRDGQGRYYSTGWTTSVDLPSTPGAFDLDHNGGSRDVYVALLSADFSSLDACTYLGGHDWGEPYHGGDHEGGCDEANGMVFDTSGNLVLVGTTHSIDFPITGAVFDPQFNDGTRQSYDGFIAVLSADLSTVHYATYCGGRHMDELYAVRVDANGDLVIAGGARSIDFPTTLDGFDTQTGGYMDGVLLRVSADLSTLLYSAYMGGTAFEQAYDLVLDDSGMVATVVGYTKSADFQFPGGGFDQVHNGDVDAFVLQSDLGASVPHTVDTSLAASPSSATLPFSSMMCADVINVTSFHRGSVGRLNVWLPGGQYYANYRGGSSTLSPLETWSTCWSQWFPDLPTLEGDIRFQLVVFDVTPSPYNQPPYPGSGDMATDQCTVTGWRE